MGSSSGGRRGADKTGCASGLTMTCRGRRAVHDLSSSGSGARPMPLNLGRWPLPDWSGTMAASCFDDRGPIRAWQACEFWMRGPRYRFPAEVRAATRAMASRMVQERTIVPSPKQLEIWISERAEVREVLGRGGYNTAFIAEDLLPLLEVFIEQAGGPSASTYYSSTRNPGQRNLRSMAYRGLWSATPPPEPSPEHRLIAPIRRPACRSQRGRTCGLTLASRGRRAVHAF